MAALRVAAGGVGGVAAVACGGLADAVGAVVGAHGLAQPAMVGTVRLFRQPAGAVSLFVLYLPGGGVKVAGACGQLPSSAIAAGGQSRRRTEGAVAPNQATGGRQGRGYRFGDRGAEHEGGNQKLVCRVGLCYRAQLSWISLALHGLPVLIAGGPLGGCRCRTAAPTHHEPTKKPRLGSGAREIRDIRTISAMKPLQMLKGST